MTAPAPDAPHGSGPSAESPADDGAAVRNQNVGIEAEQPEAELVSNPNASAGEETARSAGRGGLWLSFAKLYFTGLGLVQQIALSWLLADGYGALRGVLSPASITYNPLVTAGVQGMSRAVSRAPVEERAQVIRMGWALHAAVALVLGAAFYLGAPLLGAGLNSEYLVPSLRILSLVVVFYGIYAPAVGVLNGLRRFRAQAGLDVLSATLRSVALFVGAWLLLGQGSTRAVEGASWGFVFVAAAMVLVSVMLVGFGRGGARPGAAKEHLGFIIPVIASQVVLNLLLQADTNTLRGFATRAAADVGLAPQAADPLIGAYNAGQLFGFLPYQLLIGITFILFPMLATAHARADAAAVGRYVLGGTRIATILVGLVVSISAALPEDLLRLVFPPKFAELGTGSMRVLTLGLGAFALFGVFTTVLNSLGRQWQSLIVTALAFGAVIGLNLLWVRGTAFGPELLVKTAWATTLAMLGATLAAGYLVYVVAGAVISPTLLLRVAAIIGVFTLLGEQLPTLGRVATIAASGVVFVLYFAALALLRVFTAADWQHIQSVLGRRRA
jgi:stage V sporulation protein B